MKEEDIILYIENRYGLTLEVWRNTSYEELNNLWEGECWEYSLYNAHGDQVNREINKSPTKVGAFIKGLEEILNL